MPTWTDKIPADPRGHGLPLLRCPAQTNLEAIVTSVNLIGTETHFWGGHTVPHSPPDCEACERGSSYRWHAYQSCYNPNTQLHFIFECTAYAAAKFAEFRDAHKTLRGCQFVAYRWKRARNGRVIIKCTPTSFNLAALPPAPNLENVMAVIWRLPTPNVWVAGVQRGHPRVHADPNGNGSSTDPREYSTERP